MFYNYPAIELHRPAIELHRPAIELHRPAIELHRPAIELHRPAIELHRPAIELHRPAIELQGQKLGNLLMAEVVIEPMGQIITQVDAFTNRAFSGNPAAVCVLSSPQDDAWMQNVAQEMNLSETAFLVREGDGFSLRWFTPTVEVPLCGHATLASAHVLWSQGYLSADEVARFSTKSGVLIAKLQGDWIELDFPVNLSKETVAPSALSAALGVPYKSVWENSLGYLVEVESEDLVRQIKPNFQLLKTLPMSDIIVTSLTHPGSKYDFISRFFAPGLGINEDPVTGAAHCCLAPFWRQRLNKDEFLAYQASSRGGVVKVDYSGSDRVYLSGQAVTVLRGELS